MTRQVTLLAEENLEQSTDWWSEALDFVPGQDLPDDGSALAPHQMSPATGAVEKGAILVVDDDPSLLALVAEALQLEGYPVVTATNGAEALERIEDEQPSLVLLDMRMPVLNGWDFAQALYERQLSLPIIVMTAAQNARQWADEIRATGYLSKPFDLFDLLDQVERLRDTP